MSGKGLIGALEVGGTKFVLGIVRNNEIEEKKYEIVKRVEIATTTPSETIAECSQWFREQSEFGEIGHCGIGSFGPLDLHPSSSSYGFITTTPKPDWANVDLLSPFAALFSLSKEAVGFDTDVNAAALAHGSLADSVAYITVGTGVGVGIVSEGKPLHGALHPEMGHIFAPKHSDDASSGFEGVCPFHGCCVEGMVASRSIAARVGVPRHQLEEIPDSHPVWETVAHYLGHLVSTLVLTVSPKLIIIGGGIIHRQSLLPNIRTNCAKNLAGYIRLPSVLSEEGLVQYIISSPFGDDAGLIGSAVLAHQFKKN